MRKLALAGVLALILVAMPLLAACAKETPTTTPKPTVTVTATATTTATSTPTAKPTGTVKVGANLDLTGPYAFFCKRLVEGFRDYLYYINIQKGGIEGNKVELVWGDDGFQVPKMQSVYEYTKSQGELVHYSVSASHLTTLRPLTDRDKLPHLAQTVNTVAIDPPGYTYTHFPMQLDAWGVVLNWIKDTWKGPGTAKIGIIAYDNAIGKEFSSDVMVKEIQKAGMDFVGTNFIASSPVDATTQLLKLKDAGANYIFVRTLTPVQALIMKDATRLGVKATFVNDEMAAIEEVASYLGTQASIAEGYVTVRYSATWDENIPALAAMKKAHFDRTGEELTPDSAYYLHGWKAMSIMVEAMRLALQKVPSYKDLTPEIVNREGFLRMKNFSPGLYEGNGQVQGAITYGEGKYPNYGVTKIKLTQYTNGKQVVIKDWADVPNIMGYSATK